MFNKYCINLDIDCKYKLCNKYCLQTIDCRINLQTGKCSACYDYKETFGKSQCYNTKKIKTKK